LQLTAGVPVLPRLTLHMANTILRSIRGPEDLSSFGCGKGPALRPGLRPEEGTLTGS
jgi:hypothetical protein